jgi:ATP-dependent Clp protease adaptor protein ClpS
MNPPNESSDTGTIIKKKERLKRPRQYKVILLNDDYTTMEFVVMILERVFLKSPSEAVRIMLQVHRQGRGMCGVFSKEIAEAKAELVHRRAQDAGFPLRALVEEE